MASKNIKGITIDIGGNSTELQKALQKPEQNAKGLTAELKEIDKALKFNPENVELLGQKSAVLASQVQNAAEKLQLLRDRQQEVQDSAARGDIGTDQLRAYNRLLVETESQLNHYQKSVIDVDKQIASLTGNTKSAAASAAVFVEAQKKEADAAEKAKEEVRQHGKQLGTLRESYKEAEQGAISFGDVVRASTLGNLFADAAKKAASALWDFAAAGSESARNLELSQMQLTLILRNTVNASDDYVDSVKDLIEQQERLGVVSKNAQTAAAQELATYVTQKGTLEKLIPVLNDMIVQQYGVNASQQSAVSVATQLGKTLDGQVGSLQRWGYRFSEAEQAILKTGSESRKLNTIVKVVTDSVGGLNQGLRETTEEGRRFSETLNLSNVQERFGKSVDKIKSSIISTLLPSLTEGVEVINKYITENEAALSNLGNILATIINGLTILLRLVTSIPTPLLALIAGIALAVKTFNTASTGLTALSTTVRAFSGILDPTTIKILALVAAVAVLLFLVLALKDGTDKAASSLERAGNAAGKFATQNVNAATPRGYATGTRSAQRGLAWVGEDGPELVRFSGGEQVYTAAQSRQIAPGANQAGTAGSTYNIYHGETIRVGHVKQLKDLVYQDENKTRIYRQAGGLV